ncbi:folate-sensitive fragile site protein Fra10Ac1 [Gorgonomyces haynaldii]|nr:folate-sensitive fragile site protein Fra10Ac1 [Gorgonomyces haynaldii]
MSERDLVKEHHQFLRKEEPVEWEERLAHQYEERLFKEYCLADMKKYKSKQIAMRWRTESEVRSGKGQSVCGNVKCNRTEELKSWEVNFKYVEAGQQKEALVKLRLCPKCTKKLHYRPSGVAKK